jgi:AraC-like DNA-binding protein/predicted transcriptional regulator YdeE
MAKEINLLLRRKRAILRINPNLLEGAFAMPLDPLLTELEQNISNDINVDRLADAALLSRSQLYREFYNTTGHSVKEYVRKRRLSKALALIKHTDMSLKKIAMECGYSGEQALCKSIKAAIDQTPKQYKASGDEYYFPARHDGRAFEEQREHIVAVTTETIPPTLCLRYYDSRLKEIENRALAWLFTSYPDYSGRIFGRKGAQKGSKLCYELFIESEDADQPAISGTFAKTICPNTEDEINAAWDYLYNDWLKTSMFAMGEQPWFEEYIRVNGQVKRLHLYLPVQKRPGFHKIRLCQCEEARFLAASKSGKDAEKSASKTVMDFLAAHHPHLAQSARLFYVSVQAQEYTCGIALQSPISLPLNCGVEMITRPTGEYAILEGDCCGDAKSYETVLAAWIDSMGLQSTDVPFAVHENNGSFDRQKIRVKIYQKIEN